MRIFSTHDTITGPFPTPVATMGNFDGVHFGHQAIFRRIKQRAGELNGTSVVLTFDPHPQKILYPEKEFYLINHLEEKIDIIRGIGIDVVVCMTFSKEFAAQDPEMFIRDVLVNTLHVKELYVGHDSRFGKGKQGAPDMLQEWGAHYGFTTSIMEPISLHGEIVSSTKIRQFIQEGKVEKAAEFLARPYAVDGCVVSGEQRGAPLLGCPTANIEVLHELLPRNGVYICHVVWKERCYQAVVNIGTNPTFHAEKRTVEAHLLDFEGDLYGERIQARFLRRIRDEIAFLNVQALAAKIAEDVHTAKAFFQTNDSSNQAH
jgi:riboflavin kinase/FMN adenylyltransferase